MPRTNINWEEYIGTTVGLLTATNYKKYKYDNKPTKTVMICNCTCGNKDIEVSASAFKLGRKVHCRCVKKREDVAKLFSNEERLLTIFKAMHNRCFNESNNRFDKYDKIIGLKISDNWNRNLTESAFTNFMSWSQENSYEVGLSLDRIDVTKGYSEENCRFTTAHIQSANINQTRKNSPSKYKGVFKASSGNSKWRARIQINGKQIHLGTHYTPEDAATAYNNYIIDNGLSEYTLNNI